MLSKNPSVVETLFSGSTPVLHFQIRTSGQAVRLLEQHGRPLPPIEDWPGAMDVFNTCEVAIYKGRNA